MSFPRKEQSRLHLNRQIFFFFKFIAKIGLTLEISIINVVFQAVNQQEVFSSQAQTSVKNLDVVAGSSYMSTAGHMEANR